MNAEHRCRLGIAPRFSLAGDWSRRLAVSAPWRTPTDGELATLLREPADAEDVLLFGLPHHLLAEWGRLLEEAAERPGPLEGFDAFAGHVAAFLAFKGLPTPPGASLEAVVSGAGQAAVCWDGPLWGGVNLGDEPALVVLTGLPEREAPPVRLCLEPGEGFRLPEPGPLVTGCTPDGQGPDVFLVVRRPGQSSDPA